MYIHIFSSAQWTRSARLLLFENTYAYKRYQSGEIQDLVTALERVSCIHLNVVYFQISKSIYLLDRKICAREFEIRLHTMKSALHEITEMFIHLLFTTDLNMNKVKKRRSSNACFNFMMMLQALSSACSRYLIYSLYTFPFHFLTELKMGKQGTESKIVSW